MMEAVWEVEWVSHQDADLGDWCGLRGQESNRPKKGDRVTVWTLATDRQSLHILYMSWAVFGTLLGETEAMSIWII